MPPMKSSPKRTRQYKQYLGDDLFKALTMDPHDHNDGSLEEIDGLKEAEREVQAYWQFVAQELEEGMQ